LFYKRSYRDISLDTDKNDADNESIFKNYNDTIVARNYQAAQNHLALFKATDCDDFPLMHINYPGLLTGSGYTHASGKTGEFKIGFFFDHVTGLPVLPGHSVKGALRAHFPQYHLGNKIKYQKEKQDFIIEFLNGQGNTSDLFNKYMQRNGIIEETPAYSNELFIALLEKEIFDGLQPLVENGAWKRKKANEQPARICEQYEYRPKGIYDRDIFFEAYPAKGDEKGLLLATDSITPHEDPLKNPNPLLFLKIRSGVSLQFQFKCCDGLISKPTKLSLFEYLLTTFGVGAKTNVGYGQLTKVLSEDEKRIAEAGYPGLRKSKSVKPLNPIFKKR